MRINDQKPSILAVLTNIFRKYTCWINLEFQDYKDYDLSHID